MPGLILPEPCHLTVAVVTNHWTESSLQNNIGGVVARRIDPAGTPQCCYQVLGSTMTECRPGGALDPDKTACLCCACRPGNCLMVQVDCTGT